MKGEPTCAGIDALKALPDVAVGHRLARVYVGAEIVAGDAVKALRSEYLPLLSGSCLLELTIRDIVAWGMPRSRPSWLIEPALSTQSMRASKRVSELSISEWIFTNEYSVNRNFIAMPYPILGKVR